MPSPHVTGPVLQPLPLAAAGLSLAHRLPGVCTHVHGRITISRSAKYQVSRHGVGVVACLGNLCACLVYLHLSLYTSVLDNCIESFQQCNGAPDDLVQTPAANIRQLFWQCWWRIHSARGMINPR